MLFVYHPYDDQLVVIVRLLSFYNLIDIMHVCNVQFELTTSVSHTKRSRISTIV